MVRKITNTSSSPLEVFDRTTGEYHGVKAVYLEDNERHPYKYDGVQVRQASLALLALDRDLTKRALRIAIWLISQIPLGRTLHINRADIAKNLVMSKSDVSRGPKELHDIAKKPENKNNHYRAFLANSGRSVVSVRASAAWKGNIPDLIEAISEETMDDFHAKAKTATTLTDSPSREIP